jgi:cytochrome c556
MSYRIRGAGLAASSLLIAASVSLAQHGPPTPEQQAEKVVKTRQGVFEVQAYAFGPVGAMLKGAPIDTALVQKEAARIEMTAAMIPEVFQLDTRKFQVKTEARETIWPNKSDFDKKAGDLQNAAMALEEAAKKADRSAILDAAGKVGSACKACHEEYREK